MSLLLHSCCGPCTTYPLHFLRTLGYKADGLYFNPNIYPDAEEEKRWKVYSAWAEENKLKVKHIRSTHRCWLDAVSHDPDKPGRCELCYDVRLKETACTAKKEGYSCFSTTLLVSPYQDHGAIVRAMERASAEWDIPFVYHDFRAGYLRSRQMARGSHMYMQKYCGCEFSLGGES